MKKVKVVNDVHIGSKYSDDKHARKKLDDLENNGAVFLVGDIVDMSACPKKDVKKLRAYQQELIAKWGSNYLRGNHDLIPDHFSFLKIGKTCFTHGHLVGDKKRVAKWIKYEKKEAGAGRLKLIWVDVADDMDWLKGQRPLPEDIINEAVKLAKRNGCVEIILGHYHPLKELRYNREGVLVRCLPKGFNEIEIYG